MLVDIVEALAESGVAFVHASERLKQHRHTHKHNPKLTNTKNKSQIMSYAPVSTLDDGMATQSSSSSFRRPLNQSAAGSTAFTSAYSHIPQASQLQWMDDFYQGKPGIVAVFDRDGHLAGNFQFWHFIRITGLLVLLAILYYFMGVWVAKTQKDEDLVILDDVQSFYFLLIAGLFVTMAYRADLQQRDQHVAVTTEGIRIDQGMAMTIIIPFETIHSW